MIIVIEQEADPLVKAIVLNVVIDVSDGDVGPVRREFEGTVRRHYPGAFRLKVHSDSPGRAN